MIRLTEPNEPSAASDGARFLVGRLRAARGLNQEVTMTSATIAPQGNAPPANISALQYGPIVVATDGSTGSDAAL